MKGKVRKEYIRGTKKLLETKLCKRNLIKRINTCAVTLCKIVWTILKMDNRESQPNKPKDKEIDDDAPGYRQERWHRLILEKKEEEDSWTLRIA